VLDCAADPTGDVDVGTDLRAGEPDLVVVRAPPLVYRRARGADGPAQQVGEFLQLVVILRATDPAAAADDHPCLPQRHALDVRFLPSGDLYAQVGVVERRLELPDQRVRLRNVLDLDGIFVLGGRQEFRVGLEPGVFEEAPSPAVPGEFVGVARLDRRAVGGHRHVEFDPDVCEHFVAAVATRRDDRFRVGLPDQLRDGRPPRSGGVPVEVGVCHRVDGLDALVGQFVSRCGALGSEDDCFDAVAVGREGPRQRERLQRRFLRDASLVFDQCEYHHVTSPPRRL
jgi:hypothetical protein